MSGLVPRTCLVTAFLIALTANVALGATSWDHDTFLTNVRQIATQIDLRDATAVGRLLGADLDLRPYCGSPQCSPNKVLGMARAFPDAPLMLPGGAGVSAQYYAPDRMDPPRSEVPRVGTLAVLDVFPPRGGFCLHRSDVRVALGTETSQGWPLNQGEPLDVALNYMASRRAEYRIVISLLFSGNVADDGCLALASIRQDNSGLNPETAERRKPLALYGRPETQGPYSGLEELPDLVAPRDALDPAGIGTSPLGLTLAEFTARFPQCQLGKTGATEQGGILTEVPPPLIPLLPALDGTYLATSHSIRDTWSHGAPLAPAIDPVLLVAHKIACLAPKPLEHATPWGDFESQKFNILTFDDRIVVLFKASAAGWHTYVPAGILAAETLALAPGTAATLVQGVDEFAARGAMKIARTPRPIVLGFTANQELGTLVSASGPLQMGNDPYLMSSQTAHALIDVALWRSYSERVQQTLQALRDGKPAALAEACTPAACPFPPPEDPLLRRQPDAAMRLLRLVQALVSGGDLTDYRIFGAAAGGKALLLRNDGPIQDAVDKSADEPFTVGLAPGSTVLDGFGFQYLILPDGFGDTRPKLSPYHREAAFFRLGGRYGFGPDACITREAVIAMFGPNQSRAGRNGSDNGLIYKFDLTQTRGHTIYVTLGFPNPDVAKAYGWPNARCADVLEVKQYRLVQPQ